MTTERQYGRVEVERNEMVIDGITTMTSLGRWFDHAGYLRSWHIYRNNKPYKAFDSWQEIEARACYQELVEGINGL